MGDKDLSPLVVYLTCKIGMEKKGVTVINKKKSKVEKIRWKFQNGTFLQVRHRVQVRYRLRWLQLVFQTCVRANDRRCKCIEKMGIFFFCNNHKS